MRKFLVILLLFFCTCPLILGQSASSVKKKKKSLEKEIIKIDKQLNSTQKKKKNSIYNLTLTKKKIEYRTKLINEIEKDIDSLEATINYKNADISRLQSKLDTLEYYYKKFVINSYKNRNTKIWFTYIFSSENIGQGLRRWNYLKNMNQSLKKQADYIRDTKAKLNFEKEKLKVSKNEQENYKIAKENENIQLAKEEKQYSNTINKLKKQERKIKSQLASKKKEVSKLNKKLQNILAEELRKQKARNSKNKIDYKLSGEFSKNKNKLPWPVNNGVVVEKFGQSYHPVFKTVKLPFNNGIDISAPKDSKAKCIFDGVVKQILVMPGYSQCILVQHGEYFTFYCKIRDVHVKVGQKLKTGESIGTIETAENDNAVIHFELWKSTTKQNPELWLR